MSIRATERTASSFLRYGVAEHFFDLRPYQEPFWDAWIDDKSDRLIEIAHRRWGKDEIALRATLVKAMNRPASYWHCLPLYEQGRKALWTSVNPHTGKRRIDEAFPPEVVASRDEQAMFLRLKSGATWQIVGSDRFDSLVGAGVALFHDAPHRPVAAAAADDAAVAGRVGRRRGEDREPACGRV